MMASLLVRGLREQGHEVLILSALRTSDLWQGPRNAFALLLREAVAVHRLVSAFSPDAVLVCGPTTNYPDFFGWWPKPPRYVLFGAGVGKGNWQGRALRAVSSWVHHQALGRADVITTYQPSLVSVFERLAPQASIHCLPPIARHWATLPDKATARVALGLDQNAPVVLCVSRLTEATPRRRGKAEMVVRLARAMSELKAEAVLLLVGGGPGEGLVKQAVHTQGLEQRVRWFDSTLDLGRFYVASDVVAFPDDRDLPRLALLEAEACGRPVVTNRSSSSEMIVDHGRTGLLANDEAEFVADLDRILTDRFLAEDMGRAGVEYVRERHSMAVRLAQLESLLEAA
jgi:glycosyltransferase involved in cell wall biosynthesis